MVKNLPAMQETQVPSAFRAASPVVLRKMQVDAVSRECAKRLAGKFHVSLCWLSSQETRGTCHVSVGRRRDPRRRGQHKCVSFCLKMYNGMYI